jgi:hypothetical protein
MAKAQIQQYQERMRHNLLLLGSGLESCLHGLLANPVVIERAGDYAAVDIAR